MRTRCPGLLFEEPARAKREYIGVPGKLQADARGKPFIEVVVAGQLEEGVAVVEIDVIDRAANLELRCQEPTCASRKGEPTIVITTVTVVDEARARGQGGRNESRDGAIRIGCCSSGPRTTSMRVPRPS